MAKPRRTFNPRTFLTTTGLGRKMLSFRKREKIFAQGDAADALFVIQKGRVQVSVRSHAGKEATLDILSDGDFVGKDSVAGQRSHSASATAMTECSLLRIENKTMLQALARQVKLANLFWGYILAGNLRYQQDLADQRSIGSEKRLARILVGLAHSDTAGAHETSIPHISHETLAEIVGTTRSRVCFFMKRFKNSGFIDYGHKGQLLQIHPTLFAFCEQ